MLAAAIEKGTPLNEALPAPNGPLTFEEEDYEDCDGDPYGYGEFEMANSVQSGGVENLYTGARNSINTFFFNLEKVTGICEPYELARSMGVQLNAPEGIKNKAGDFIIQPERVPNFTLGVADVSPLEMAEAYATFGARGLHCDSRPVTSIKDANGNLLKDYPPRCAQVMSESTADAVNDILRGVIEGGFAANEALSVPAAGKTGTTGTTDSSPAVWFVGYTPQLATAAMIAGANEFGTPIGLDGQVINGVTVSASGSGLAAPMWGDAMKVIDDGLDYIDFEPADSVPGFGQESVYVAPSSGSGFDDEDDDDGRR